MELAYFEYDNRRSHSIPEPSRHAFVAPRWFHADRAAGGDRDHRGPARPLVAGRAGGLGGGPAYSVHNNLKQLGLALHNYVSAVGVLPMSMSLSGTGNTTLYNTGWSAQARILPYLEGSPSIARRTCRSSRKTR